mgnify:FL=1
MSNLLSLTPMPTIALLTPPAWAEFAGILPGLIPALTALVLILLNVFHRGTESPRDYLAYVASIGLGLTLVTCWVLWDDTLTRPIFHGTLYLDRFSLFFTGLCSASGLLAMLMSPRFLRSHGLDRVEYYMLILLSVSGMAFLVQSADLLTFFVAFEAMSIPVYCIAAFMRRDARSAEAGMKYFILGAFSAALMLYGIAMLYGATGTTNLEVIGETVIGLMTDPASQSANGIIMLGMLLVLSGFAFKVAAAPFHLWTPDVYNGSPTPSVGFMATAVKAAAFAPMIRVLNTAFGHVGQMGAGEAVQMISLRGGFYGYGWIDVLLVLAGASMVLGNLVAITQSNVKRMLAYSSIAHAGYILVGFIASGAETEFFLYHDAVLFYLVSYTFGTLGAFGVLAYFERQGRSVETYDDLAGLGWQFPTIGLLMGTFMFSSAGIPPTAGFVGKLYVFKSAVDVGQATGDLTFIWLAVLAVLTSVAGVYYYLRVLVSMYMYERDEQLEGVGHPAAKFALVVCGFFSLYLGILPGGAMDMSRQAVIDMAGAPESIQEVQQDGREALKERLRVADEGTSDE